MPRLYLATSYEVAEVLHNEREGRGDSILYEYKEWTKKAVAAVTTDSIPSKWDFTEDRVRTHKYCK